MTDEELIAKMRGADPWTAPYFANEALSFAADRIEALMAVTVVVKPDRETFDALCAMRDAINEYVPMPSLESDLLQGPENSVFCATVAEAVISEIRKLRAALEPVAAPDPAAIREADWQNQRRVDAMRRRHMNAPEDPHISALCERYGYGAVMDAASRLWARKDSMGAFYVGGCIGLKSDDEADALIPTKGTAE